MAAAQPTTKHGWLADKTGARFPFTFTSENWLREWRVFHEEVWIGVGSCSLQGDDMNLADLRFRDDIYRQRSLWERVCRRPPEKTNYQRRGLGTGLLLLIIAHARDTGCRRMTGIVTRNDVASNPNLVDWYRRHGFEFVPAEPDLRVAGNLSLALK